MEFVIKEEEAGQRLDQILKTYCPDNSRAKLQKYVREGFCNVNGEPETNPAAKMKIGQSVKFEFAPEQSSAVPESGPLELLWHDNCLAVCAKPPYLTVHPCPSCPDHTLVNRLLGYFPELAQQGGLRPGIVHRLDKDTSGLILTALTEQARQKLAEAFASRQVKKEYLAIVYGNPATGESRLAIGRHQIIKTKMAIVSEKHGGKPAHSAWRTLWHDPVLNISLLAVKIFTGRTHQIRVHLANAGHPILGDKIYAPAHIAALAPRQMLHAWQLWFEHPETGSPMHFLTPPPDDFYEILINTCRPAPIVITGNQGCGKSSICKILQEKGFPLISADAVVAKLYKDNSHVADWLLMNYGPDILNPDRSVNKAELMKILLDASQRKEFEEFIHPLVHDEIQRFFNLHKSEKPPIAEIPLFYESSWQNSFDPKPLTVVIHCPQQTRFARIRASRGWSEDKIHHIESWQIPEENKLKMCDIVLDNSGDQEKTLGEIEKMLHVITSIDKRKNEDLTRMLRNLCENPCVVQKEH